MYEKISPYRLPGEHSEPQENGASEQQMQSFKSWVATKVGNSIINRAMLAHALWEPGKIDSLSGCPRNETRCYL